MNLEESYLGEEAFSSPLSELECGFFFTLTDEQRAVVLQRRGRLNRIGLALHVGALRMTGRLDLSAHLVPPNILRHVAGQLGEAAPDLASLRSIYRDRTTRFRHQHFAAELLGFREPGDGGRAGLVQYLNRETLSTLDIDQLAQRARIWLFKRNYLLLSTRALRSLCRRAIEAREAAITDRLRASMVADCEHWIASLSEKLDSRTTRMEWLRAGPRRKSIPVLEEQAAKIRFLRGMGVDNFDLSGLPDAAVTMYARRVALRKASALHRRKEPGRTLEVACFLRQQIQKNTDSAVELFNHLVNDLVRRSRDRAVQQVARSAASFGTLVSRLQDLAGDKELSAGEIRERLSTLIAPYRDTQSPVMSRAMATRQDLSMQSKDIARLLAALTDLDLEIAADHPLAAALSTFHQIQSQRKNNLAKGQTNVFGPSWQRLIGDEDRGAAFGSWCAATILLAKRSLRNGSVSISHSRDYRTSDKHLIPSALWERDRGRFTRNLIRGKSSEAYVRRVEQGLSTGLKALAQSLDEGTVRLVEGRISLPKIPPRDLDVDVRVTRDRLFARLGATQLSDVIIEVDHLTGLARALLGRQPYSDRERVLLYAAILALGSDLDPADIERKVADVSAESVGQMMRTIETSGRLREANTAVVRFMGQLDVSGIWGPGMHASADMMSLDATRTLWSARSDPRRKTLAMGTYTHVLDQWSLIYDQPLVLNQRQAGAALEGALRHDGGSLERLAVDTHGMTHFSMGFGKLLGYDICPRLARLSERKLYVFKDTKVPSELEPMVSRSLSRRSIALGWDGLLHLAASTQNGWCSAVWAVERHSSASIGMPVYKA